MPADKPLTRFLIALAHSRELLAEFNSDRRPDLLSEWGVADNDLFQSEDWTLERVRAAVAEEHDDGTDVDVAWWIWFFGGPRPGPDWIWGPNDDPDGGSGGGGGGPPYTQ